MKNPFAFLLKGNRVDLKAVGVKIFKGGLYGAAGAATGLSLMGLHDWRSFLKGAAGAVLSGFLHGAHEAVKQAIANPPETEFVYLAVTLDGPIVGASLDQPRKPWILITGATLKDVAAQIPRINWHAVPLGVRSRLELGDQSFSISLEDAKRVLEGI